MIYITNQKNHEQSNQHEEHYHHEQPHHEYHHRDNHHHEEHHQHEEHHHHEHKEPKEYSMIEWDPAYQEPPNTGRLGADIPDLSSFRNVWDQPRIEQADRWVAPVHQPEPQIMTKPEYSHYNAHEYAPDAYYAPIHHEFNPPAESEPAPEPEPFVQQQDYHHHEEPQHHHHYHHEEPQHPPSFPWDNKPDHFPPPTRVWQDEQPPQQSESVQYQQEQSESNHHHGKLFIYRCFLSYKEETLILSYCLSCLDNHVEEQQQYQYHEEHYEEPSQPPQESQHQQHNLNIVIDHHDDQQVETPM